MAVVPAELDVSPLVMGDLTVWIPNDEFVA